MFNKKGQQEVSMGTVLLIIIGVIAVVLIVVSVTGGFGYLGSLIGKSPGDLTAFSQSCVTYSKARLYNDYCREFREGEILGVKGFFNCQYEPFEEDIKKDAVTLDCLSRYGVEYESDESSAEKYCSDSKSAEGKEFDEDTKVNGKSCESWLEVSASAGGAPEEDEIPEGEELPILNFDGAGGKILTLEECKATLEERKKNLEIPDKLCYWQTITEVYDKTCENLGKTEIAEIFEKKAEYRKLESDANWPNLNTDGDFCIPVIYDCDSWLKLKTMESTTAGFFNPTSDKESKLHPSISGNPSGEIQINPFREFKKEIVQNTILLHEGLHSIKMGLDSKGGTHLGEGEKYATAGIFFGEQYDVVKDLSNQQEVYKIILNLMDLEDVLQNKIASVWEKSMAELKIEDFANLEDYDAEHDKRINEFGEATDILLLIPYVSEPAEFEPAFRDKVKGFLEKYNDFDEEVEKVYNQVLEGKTRAYVLTFEVKIKGYVGSKVEVDPRLSEVQRWWLEQTAPNCEVILTQEKAREVLDKFLAEKNLPDEYKWSQQDLKLLLYVYKGTEYEQEIYNLLVSRLPGLAEAETDGETLA